MSYYKFILDNNGVQKCLLKIREVPNREDKKFYDLNITFPGVRKVLQPSSVDQLDIHVPELVKAIDKDLYEDIKDRHISVHASTKSPENTMFKQTTQFRNGKIVSYSHVTPAIKRDGLFAPIAFKFIGNIADSRFDASGKSEYTAIQLGKCSFNDPILFMIILGPKGIDFPQEEEHPSNQFTHHFSEFSITVIWSFPPFENIKQGLNLFSFTKREEAKLLHGVSHKRIYDEFSSMTLRLAKYLIKGTKCNMR